jgi:hypothetical protein
VTCNSNVGPDSLNDLGGCLLQLLHASPQQRLLGKPNREPKPSVANDELMYTGVALIIHRCVVQSVSQALEDRARLQGPFGC